MANGEDHNQKSSGFCLSEWLPARLTFDRFALDPHMRQPDHLFHLGRRHTVAKDVRDVGSIPIESVQVFQHESVYTMIVYTRLFNHRNLRPLPHRSEEHTSELQ